MNEMQSIKLLVRFVCIVAGYLIGGIVFMRFKNNANGMEMIPNISLWKEFPDYVKV
jgi:hypothetical protein